MSTGWVEGDATSEGLGERMEEGNAREERWVDAVKYSFLVGRVNGRGFLASREDEPGECVAPCGVSALHEGVTLDPFRPPVAFTVQRCTVQIGTAEDVALGRGEMEGRQQGFSKRQALNIRKMVQDVGEAVCCKS